MNRLHRQEGSISIWIVTGILVLVGFAALAIDSGKIYVARTQLAGSSDAAALAAMQTLRSGGTILDARSAAKRIGELNRVLDGGVQLAATDIIMGDYDYQARVFRPGGTTLAPAVEVTSRRTSGSGNALPLALANVIGSSQADVLARSVASTGCREIVLVQDVTISFAEEIADARTALHSFVNVMTQNALPGDQLGLVIFAAEGRTLIDLAPMPQNAAAIDSLIDSTVKDCRYNPTSLMFPGEPEGACHGTDQAMGINKARDMFANHVSTCGGERTVIIISDGVPCGTYKGQYAGQGTPGGTEAGVVAAADAAEAEGLNISPIMLWDPLTPEQQCTHPGMGALAFNDAMARGWGQPLNTPDSDELTALLRSVLSQIPVRLVE